MDYANSWQRILPAVFDEATHMPVLMQLVAAEWSERITSPDLPPSISDLLGPDIEAIVAAQRQWAANEDRAFTADDEADLLNSLDDSVPVLGRRLRDYYKERVPGGAMPTGKNRVPIAIATFPVTEMILQDLSAQKAGNVREDVNAARNFARTLQTLIKPPSDESAAAVAPDSPLTHFSMADPSLLVKLLPAMPLIRAGQWSLLEHFPVLCDVMMHGLVAHAEKHRQEMWALFVDQLSMDVYACFELAAFKKLRRYAMGEDEGAEFYQPEQLEQEPESFMDTFLNEQSEQQITARANQALWRLVYVFRTIRNHTPNAEHVLEKEMLITLMSLVAVTLIDTKKLLLDAEESIEPVEQVLRQVLALSAQSDRYQQGDAYGVLLNAQVLPTFVACHAAAHARYGSLTLPLLPVNIPLALQLAHVIDGLAYDGWNAGVQDDPMRDVRVAIWARVLSDTSDVDMAGLRAMALVELHAFFGDVLRRSLFFAEPGKGVPLQEVRAKLDELAEAIRLGRIEASMAATITNFYQNFIPLLPANNSELDKVVAQLYAVRDAVPAEMLNMSRQWANWRAPSDVPPAVLKRSASNEMPRFIVSVPKKARLELEKAVEAQHTKEVAFVQNERERVPIVIEDEEKEKEKETVQAAENVLDTMDIDIPLFTAADDDDDENVQVTAATLLAADAIQVATGSPVAAYQAEQVVNYAAQLAADIAAPILAAAHAGAAPQKESRLGADKTGKDDFLDPTISWNIVLGHPQLRYSWLKQTMDEFEATGEISMLPGIGPVTAIAQRLEKAKGDQAAMKDIYDNISDEVDRRRVYWYAIKLNPKKTNVFVAPPLPRLANPIGIIEAAKNIHPATQWANNERLYLLAKHMEAPSKMFRYRILAFLYMDAENYESRTGKILALNMGGFDDTLAIIKESIKRLTAPEANDSAYVLWIKSMLNGLTNDMLDKLQRILDVTRAEFDRTIIMRWHAIAADVVWPKTAHDKYRRQAENIADMHKRWDWLIKEAMQNAAS